MVRLKVKYVMGINTFEEISIPYGAIIYDTNIHNFFRNTKFFAYYFIRFFIDIYQFFA